jgi:hypothetical protein
MQSGWNRGGSYDRPRVRRCAAAVPEYLGCIHAQNYCLLGTARSLLKLPAAFDGTAERPEAIFAQAATTVLSVVYLAFGVRSFIAARRARSVSPPA